MTIALKYLLLGDGGRDIALLPVVDWAIGELEPSITIAERMFHKRHGSVDEAMRRAVALYRPDILFVHRDAEALAMEVRRAEIPDAHGRVVRIVPVRMTEAWLLIDELAIRRAAGNPSGCQPLDLPPPDRIEDLPNPKRVLSEALLRASGFSSPRRRKRFQREEASSAVRVSGFVREFPKLRRLRAFRAFESELGACLCKWREGLTERSDATGTSIAP